MDNDVLAYRVLLEKRKRKCSLLGEEGFNG